MRVLTSFVFLTLISFKFQKIVNGEIGENFHHVLEVVAMEHKLERESNWCLRKMGEFVLACPQKQDLATLKIVLASFQRMLREDSLLLLSPLKQEKQAMVVVVC